MRIQSHVFRFVLLVFLVVGLLIMFGCGMKDGKNRASTEPADIYIYAASGGDPDWFEETYGMYFAKKFPHITFHVTFAGKTTIQDHLASGAPLDIIKGAYSTFFRNVLDVNLQSDITDLIKAHKINLDDYDPTVIALQRQLANGAMYGLPAYMGTSGLYYNKDLFDKFAVDYPQDGMTWDEVYDLAVILTRRDGDQQYYGFANDNMNYIQANQLSLDLVDPSTFKANFQSEPWKRVVQTLTRFMTIQGVDIAETTVAAFNTKGTVAMATNYTGCCGFTPGEAVTNWDVVRIPDFPELRNVGPQVFPNFWSMSSISKNREVAFEVISWVASREFQISLNNRGLATVLKDKKLHEQYGQDLPKYNGKNVTALFPKPHANVSRVTPYQSVAAGQLNNALNQIATGKDMNTALREAAEETDKLIETARSGSK